MASHMRRNTNMTSSEQQTDREFVTAFMDLQKDVRNNERFLEFVHNYYVNKLKTPEFCAALQQRFPGVSDPPTVEFFFHELSRLYDEHVMMRQTLQSLHCSFDHKLDCIGALKKVSVVFFTAKSKNPAAVAAAAAVIVFGALGKWIHSLLKKRESAVKKHKETVKVMIMGDKATIKDLSNIHGLARLQFETEAMSEMVDDGEKLAAAETRFQELRGKAEDYSRDLDWARAAVIQSIIKHLD